MAKFNKSSGTGGKWIDKKALYDSGGGKVKLVSEAKEEPSNMGGTQIVAKCRVQGSEESVNIGINTPTKNALIDAYGDDSKDWVDKVLTAHLERTMVAGKRGIALYLVPDGYEVAEDSGGYLVIQKIGTSSSQSDGSDDVDSPFEDEDADEIPF